MVRNPPAKPRQSPRARKPARKPGKGARKATPAAQAAQRLQRIKKDSILASLAQGATHKAACEAAGIDRTTHWRWCNEDKVYAEACMEAEAGCVRRVEAALYINALKPEGRTDRIFFLKNRAKYRDNPPEAPSVPPEDPQPLTGADGKPDLTSMNEDQLNKYLARLQREAAAGD